MYGTKKNSPRHPLLRLACILAACLSMPSVGNGIADGKIQGIFNGQSGERNGLTYNEQQINDNGREQKLDSAKDKSNTGQTMAAITGAMLISTGSAMVPSIITPVSVAGAELIAKGIQELAQAAADGSTKDQNGAGEDRLMRPIDGTSPTKSSDIQLPADLQNLLASHGVNPDAFLQSAAAGQIQNGNDVLKALGLPQASGDDLAKAQQIANDKLNTTLAQASPGSPLSQATTVDENAKAGGPAADAGQGGLGADGILSENSRGASSLDGSVPGTGAADSAAAMLAAGGAGAGYAAGGGDAGGQRGVSSGLAGLMAGMGLGGDLEGAAAAAGKGLPTRAQLLGIGVLPPQPKQNIFQIAHRNFRSFQKWRNLRRVAQK